MKRIPGLLILLMTGTNAFCISGNENLSSDPLKVLFLGASYFAFNDFVDMVQNLADSSGKEVYLDYYFGPGYYLDDHANCPVTDSMIRLRDWDYVFLQGVGNLTAYPDKFPDHKVDPALRILKQKISSACNSARTFFCLPWAFEDGMTWMGWPDDYQDMQVKIYANTLQLAGDIGLMIAPVGWAWSQVLEVKGYPLHYLHRPDWNHPSVQGSYLMACVIYTSIFQESTTGIPYYRNLEESEARSLQSAGSQTVLKDPGLWNMTELPVNTGKSADVPDFQCIQNYPNPFLTTTRIQYEVREAGPVEFSVYDLAGRAILLRKQTIRSAGSYSFSFDGKDLPGGVYLYNLKLNDRTANGKMILNKR